MAAWSPAKQALLWQRDVETDWPRQHDYATPLPGWPHVVDLDGDGSSEVLAPDGSTPRNVSTPPWGKLALLDGRTGEPRWLGQIFNMDRQLSHFLSGPDIDGDGAAEVYVASQWGKDYRLFVDCLSGADGRTLWRCEQPLLLSENENGSLLLADLFWCDGTGDGWPQLVVPVRGTQGELADRVALISAGTGRLTHLALDVTEVESGDLDADGVHDLVLFRRANRHAWDQGGTLHGFHGVGREAWRKIVDPQIAVGDFNGDGVSDLVAPRTRGPLTAYCGATGDVIWTRNDNYRRELFVHAAITRDLRHDVLSKPHDLDGDSTPDLLLAAGESYFREELPVLLAVSGRTGRRLWQADFFVQRFNRPLLLECRDLDGDSQVEIVLAAESDYGQPFRDYFSGPRNDVRLWLTVLSGRDGRTRWTYPLTEPQPQSGGGDQFELRDAWPEAAYADLDGDRVEDLLLPAQRTPGDLSLDLWALSGVDGRSLWRFPLPGFQNPRESFGNVVPAAPGDLDGDGQSEVVAMSLTAGENEAGRHSLFVRIQAIDGKTGSLRWQWETGEVASTDELRGDPAQVKDRLRPVLLRRPDGGHWIAVPSWEGRGTIPAHVHVLDEAGNVVSKNEWRRSPGGQAAAREQSLLLARLLEQLPEDYRQVILFRNLEDLPHEEVARRMNRSEGAVRMLWLRALARLRKELLAEE